MIQETEIEKWRAETFLTKEPETIAWIESFEEGSIFYDVGANIGIYSLYCAYVQPLSLQYAFEPDTLNYLRILKNRQLNGFLNLFAFRIGIGATNELSYFYPCKDVEGASGGQMGYPINEKGESYLPTDAIPTLIMSLDYFVEKYCIAVPTHIKIDIDGLEECVIMGMKNLLRQKELRSVLVELNEKTNKANINDIMSTNGFKTDNRFNSMENHSRHRRNREGIKAENWIFTR